MDIRSQPTIFSYLQFSRLKSLLLSNILTLLFYAFTVSMLLVLVFSPPITFEHPSIDESQIDTSHINAVDQTSAIYLLKDLLPPAVDLSIPVIHPVAEKGVNKNDARRSGDSADRAAETRPGSTPTSIKVPKPTATKRPTPTVKPTASPKPTPSPRPSPTPKPTSTPRPSSTPKPSPSSNPSPTITPSLTNTPQPSLSPLPTMSPIATPTETPQQLESGY